MNLNLNLNLNHLVDYYRLLGCVLTKRCVAHVAHVAHRPMSNTLGGKTRRLAAESITRECITRQ